MKHLNPRQGITTAVDCALRPQRLAVECETPKSPPGDYNEGLPGEGDEGDVGVKHLNPRQGITTRLRCRPQECRKSFEDGVKHLNPRQGITTCHRWRRAETRTLRPSVKHLNPSQGITTNVDNIRHQHHQQV